MGSSNKFDVQLLNLDLSTAHFTNENFGHSDPGFKLAFKGELYQDTGSVEPGSRPLFGSVSGSENQFWGIFTSKDTFCLYYRYISGFF